MWAMNHRMKVAAIGAVICALASPAAAWVLGGEIVQQSGAGEFVILDPSEPFAVGADTFNTDHLYAFNEDQNITLIEPIRVDIGGCMAAPTGRGGVIAAGTVVASHYVFFDSVDGIHYGYVNFDAPILGIAAFQDSMAATDFLANTNVTYLSLELRGLERGDQVWVDEDDPHRLWVYWAGSSPGDYIRVFTAQSSAAPLM